MHSYTAILVDYLWCVANWTQKFCIFNAHINKGNTQTPKNVIRRSWTHCSARMLLDAKRNEESKAHQLCSLPLAVWALLYRWWWQTLFDKCDRAPDFPEKGKFGGSVERDTQVHTMRYDVNITESGKLTSESDRIVTASPEVFKMSLAPHRENKESSRGNRYCWKSWMTTLKEWGGKGAQNSTLIYVLLFSKSLK